MYNCIIALFEYIQIPHSGQIPINIPFLYDATKGYCTFANVRPYPAFNGLYTPFVSPVPGGQKPPEGNWRGLNVKLKSISIMSIKVKAVERQLKFSKDPNAPAEYRYILQADLYSRLSEAKVIKEAFPEVYESYMRSFDGKSAEDLYGKVGIVNVSKTLAIANVYSQLDYGNPAQTGKVYTNAEYLARAVDSVCKRFPEKTVYVPEGIGCGFGGGNWSEIKALLASLGHSNLYLLDTKAQKARPLVASVSRQEFNERLSEIISNGVEKTNREFGVLAKPAEWFTKKEEEAFSLLKEIVLADEDEDVPENVAKYFSGYLAERAIAHGKTDLVDEMVETEKEISALYKGLLEWEHTKDEKNEQNEPILDGR